MELKLYEVAEELRQLCEGEEWDDAAVDALAVQFEQKAAGIVAISERMEAFAAYCKAEEERIAAKRKAVENRIASMKNYIKGCMEQAGIAELPIGTKKLAIQNSPESVVIDDETKIPMRYILIKQTQQVDKNMLKLALKSGEKIDGAHLEKGTHLRVR